MATSTATQKLTITLPKDVADLIRASVSSGEYSLGFYYAGREL
jgi:hypothetical protein